MFSEVSALSTDDRDSVEDTEAHAGVGAPKHFTVIVIPEMDVFTPKSPSLVYALRALGYRPQGTEMPESWLYVWPTILAAAVFPELPSDSPYVFWWRYTAVPPTPEEAGTRVEDAKLTAVETELASQLYVGTKDAYRLAFMPDPENPRATVAGARLYPMFIVPVRRRVELASRYLSAAAHYAGWVVPIPRIPGMETV